MQISVSKAMVGRYLYLPTSELNVRQMKSLRELASVRNKFDRTVTQLCVSNDQWFGVPLYAGVTVCTPDFQDTRAAGQPLDLKMTSELWGGQQKVLFEFGNYLDGGKTGFLLDAAPGSGKTVMILKMLELLGRSALIVVPRSGLVEQWVERFLEHSNIKRSDIGTATDGKLSWKPNQKILVALVHSLSNVYDQKSMSDAFGVVVFDEVDRAVPPATFAPVATIINAKYRIGASATIERQDGMHEILVNHIGEVHLKGAVAERMSPVVIMQKFTQKSIRHITTRDTLMRRGVLLSALSKNIARNKLILKYAQLFYNSGRRFVIISDRSNQLYNLRQMMSKKYDIPLAEMGLYVRTVVLPNGKKKTITKRERIRIASDCKIIFATYGMMSLGIDIPDLAGLIYATPQSDIKQTKGRIERAFVGKKKPVIVDIVDKAHPEAERWARKRLATYQASGMVIQTRG